MNILLPLLFMASFGFSADPMRVADSPATPVLHVPAQAEFVNQIGGRMGAVVLQEPYAFLAEGPSLTTLDVSHPDYPRLLAKVRFPGPVLDVAVAGQYAYLANGTGGLRILDISDPRTPQEVGAYDGAWVSHVTLSGKYAYLLDSADGDLLIFDVADPVAPILVGTYDTYHSFNALAVSGQFAYIAVHSGTGVLIVDVADPALPVLAGTYHTGTITDYYMLDVAVIDDLLYVATAFWGLRIVDVSNPAAPVEIGFYDEEPGSDANVVAVTGDRAYLLDGTDYHRLRIVDVSNPEAPVRTGMLELPEAGRAVAVGADHALVADDGSGLRVVDVSDPAAPAEISAYDPLGAARLVVVRDRRAFVIEGLDYPSEELAAVRILSVADPARPVTLGRQILPDAAQGITAYGTYAYVADGFGGLRILDLSDPWNPFEAGSLDLGGSLDYIMDVAAEGEVAYLVDSGDTCGECLRVVDVSSPSNPVEVGHLAIPNLQQVQVAGPHAYVTDGSSLRVIDVSAPGAPAQVGMAGGWPWGGGDLAHTERFAYVQSQGTGTGDLRIIDVLNPTAPAEIGHLTIMAERVAPAGDSIYLTSFLTHTRIVDASDPALPLEVGTYPTFGTDIEAVGRFLYVVEPSSGLTILWFARPASDELPPAGGTLTSLADQTSYTFPSGAFTGTVTVTHTPRYPGNLPPPIEGQIGIDHAYEVGAVYVATDLPAQPAAPYTVTVEYDDLELGAAMEGTLALYHLEGDAWILEPTSDVEGDANSVTAAPGRLGVWSVFGETRRVYLPLVRR